MWVLGVDVCCCGVWERVTFGSFGGCLYTCFSGYACLVDFVMRLLLVRLPFRFLSHFGALLPTLLSSLCLLGFVGRWLRFPSCSPLLPFSPWICWPLIFRLGRWFFALLFGSSCFELPSPFCAPGYSSVIGYSLCLFLIVYLWLRKAFSYAASWLRPSVLLK